MDPATPFKEELELDAILEKETELVRRRKEFEENQRRIERERAERDRKSLLYPPPAQQTGRFRASTGNEPLP